MSDTQQAETPMSDHVSRFWQHMEKETVRILLDLKRTVGVDAPDGPVVYWDGASFSDDVAKAIVDERKRLCDGLQAAIRAAELALFVVRKQDVMPNSSWETGFKRDMATAHAATTSKRYGIATGETNERRCPKNRYRFRRDRKGRYRNHGRV